MKARLTSPDYVLFNTMFIGSVTAVANLGLLLYTVLLQKTRIFKTDITIYIEPDDQYNDQIFWALIAIYLGQALHGILLIIAALGRKGALKILAYPWIPNTGILLFTPFILQWLSWGGQIHYWNEYYEKIKTQPDNWTIAFSIIGVIACVIWFSICSTCVWAFIRSDNKNSADPCQS